MTARVLELTQSVKVENVPASVSTDYIAVYFESARNGGGPVSDVQLFPEENSAIVTFCDRKGNAVLLLTKVLPGRGPERQSLQTWALGEAWLAVAEGSVRCPVPGKGSRCRNAAALLGFQNLFVLIPASCRSCSH